MGTDDNDTSTSNQKDGIKSTQSKKEENDKQLKVDIDWYMTQQILPPIARLCEPIEGANSAVLAERLGIDSKQFRNQIGMAAEEEDEWGFTPLCRMEDAERFQDCSPLKISCLQCRKTNEFRGVYQTIDLNNSSSNSVTKKQIASGLTCPNP